MDPLKILKYFIDIKREQWLDRDSLEKVQREKLEKMLKSAYLTKHYRKLMDDNNLVPDNILTNLDLLPLTKKEDIRDDPDSFIPKGISKENLRKIMTSGSTGIPLKIFMDEDAQNYRTAIVYAAETLFGRSPFELYAHITYERYSQHPLLSMTGLFPKLCLSAFEDEAKNFSILENSKAKMLRSYPSVLTMVAKLNDDKSRPLKYKSIYSSAEILSREARKLISDSFSCLVFNHYGAEEVRSVGFECPEEHNLHVNCSSCIVEILGKNGKPKKSGIGDIVVTCLHNKSMPFLRYAIGDRGSWGKECSCGRSFPVLKSMEGRKDDTITLPSGRMRSAFVIHPMYNVKGVLSYQVIQKKPDLFVFRYVTTKKQLPGESKKEVIRRIKRGCLGEEVTVEFEEAESIKRGRTGKLKNVVSKVKS